MNIIHVRTVLFALLALFLVACGGGQGAKNTLSSTTVDNSKTTQNTTNSPPLVNAGTDYSAATGDLITLTGTASDADGDPISTVWSFTSTPAGSTASLSKPDQLDASFTADRAGTYTLELMASDGTDQASDTISISISAPYNGGTYTGTVPAAQVGATVVGLTIEDTSGTEQNNVPITFGQVFKPGEIPAGTLLGVRLANGTQALIPSQIDKKATHADGSLRHAVITARVPSLIANNPQAIEIVVVDSAPTTPPVKLADLLATNFDGVVSLNLAGTTYTASIADLLKNTQAKTWLSGPEVTEWMVSTPLKAADGTEHPHLSARFNVRAYAGFDSVRVDVVIENDWAYVPNPQNFVYDVNISLCGNNVYSKTALTHYHHARWRKTFWCGKKPAIHIKHDVNYLIDSYAVPNYDRSLVIPEADLATMETNWTGSKTEPMGIGAAEAYMPGTGARSDIGPLPRWTTQYLLSQDSRAKQVMLGTANLAGSWSIHYRDKNTDTMISIDDYPSMTLLGRYGDTYNSETGKYEAFPDCSGDCTTPYTPDDAHEPSLAYLPYLITGDYFFLEELQFWANYNMVLLGPGNRGFSAGLLNSGQLRAQAWSMRTLGDAAYITPDDNNLKQYFIEKLQNNITWYNNNYTNNTNSNSLGIITSGYALSGLEIAPWGDDFFTWSIKHLVELGFSAATDLLKWKATFPVGRMTDSNFCWVFASSYILNVRSSSSSPLYTTFKEVYENTVDPKYYSMACGGVDMATSLGIPENSMIGYADNAYGYPSNLQPALAAAADTNNPAAIAAWNKFENRSVKPGGRWSYNHFPNYAIIPR